MSQTLNSAVVDNIVKACLKLYSEIPKSGKPTENEWTVLSCVVKIETDKAIEVVSLGTGSKCIGATKMSPRGDLLNDSHAEVFARRGFLLYLYDNVEKALKSEPSIFTNIDGKYQLKSSVELAFFSSQLPCGDASIIPKSENNELIGDLLQPTKRKFENRTEFQTKKRKCEEDIHRTGAKCLPNTDQDSKEPGSNYHTVGLVRTKPGRGDRTLSVSCSDKIARWAHIGIQGSLLSLLCAPIYIRHYVFGAGVPYSKETLQRAILNRNSDYEDVKMVWPQFYQSSIQFEYIKSNASVRPAAGSIVWVKLDSLLSEVAVQGKKLGLTKKKAVSPTNSLCISKYNLYKKFLNILKTNTEIKKEILNIDNLELMPYNEMKKKSLEYYERWSEIKNKFFKSWTVKPDMWDFCVE